MRNSPAILVVDDSPFVARALVHVLESRGLKAHAASTMDEAVTVCDDFHPGVLVADVCMPNIDLIELCRRVRAAASGLRPAVLLFSAHSEQEIGKVIAATGADAFVEKRHGAAVVAARVEALCAWVASQYPSLTPSPSPG